MDFFTNINRYHSFSLMIASLFLAPHPFALADGAIDFPNRSVRIVVPFPPGGTVDILPRIVAAQLSKAWNQPVVIENRPGAGGNIGAAAVARATPDGYTLMLAPPGPLAINESLYSSLPYSPEDFAPITILGTVPNILAIRSNLPVDSVKGFIEHAAKVKGRVTMATQGNGTTSHLTGALFEHRTATEFTYIPYKGSSPALADLMSGQVDAFFDNIGSAHTHHKAGKVKILAIAGNKRNPLLSDVPTFAESGLSGFDTGAWFGLVAPRGTQKEIIKKINQDVLHVLNSPEVQRKFAEQGADIIGNTPEEMDVFITQERDRWRKVINQAKVTLN